MKYTSTLSYKTRNIMVLLTFLILIIIIGGYYAFFSYPRKIKQLEIKINQLERQIRPMQGVEERYVLIQQQVEEEQEKLAELDKQIVEKVTPADTYNYLNQILKYTGNLKVDLLYNRSDAGKGYGYNVYTLKGEGSFHRIFKFLWYLERGPQIYRVKKLTLRGVEKRDPETEEYELILPYEMEMWALFAALEDLPPIKRKLGNVAFQKQKNVFYPYIKRDIPSNKEGLLEVERAELKAVMPGKAFIADYTGRIHVLDEGAKVYLGYITRIDPGNGRVEFTLNKGGIVEKYTLTLGFD